VKPAAVIFDMDGTLVDVTTVRHHVLDRRRKNYDAFHYGSIFCPPHEWVAAAAREHHAAGTVVLVVTAREDRWRALSSGWLDYNGIPHHELHMRPTGDFRRDRLIKAEILADLRKRYDIRHAYDDNPAIIGLWEDEGVPATVVPGWAEQ
jgi:phosphoglycolate phosphatase-like HAD superfamily hydrolase